MLADHLDLDVMTVTGKTKKTWKSWEKIISSDRRRISPQLRTGSGSGHHSVETTKEMGSIAVLKGNLAPEGAVCKIFCLVRRVCVPTKEKQWYLIARKMPMQLW